jgi:hypothetical protein
MRPLLSFERGRAHRLSVISQEISDDLDCDVLPYPHGIVAAGVGAPAQDSGFCTIAERSSFDVRAQYFGWKDFRLIIAADHP